MRLLGKYLLLKRAPKKEPIAPTNSKGHVNAMSNCAVAKCGISDEKDGGVTAIALIPAAIFASNPRIINVGINKNPGPTPKNPLKTEIGIASSIAIFKFSFPALALTDWQLIFRRVKD